jgi:hypothetical protein
VLGAADRGHPIATGVGYGYPSFVQQPPQLDTAVSAPAVLNIDAARMTRFAGYDHHAAASCTRDTSSRIHKPTVSSHHGGRDRCRMDAGVLPRSSSAGTAAQVRPHRAVHGERRHRHAAVIDLGVDGIISDDPGMLIKVAIRNGLR